MADKGPAPAGPYSHAVVANRFVFVSGQGPVDPETGTMPDGFRGPGPPDAKERADDSGGRGNQHGRRRKGERLRDRPYPVRGVQRCVQGVFPARATAHVPRWPPPCSASWWKSIA